MTEKQPGRFDDEMKLGSLTNDFLKGKITADEFRALKKELTGRRLSRLKEFFTPAD